LASNLDAASPLIRNHCPGGKADGDEDDSVVDLLEDSVSKLVAVNEEVDLKNVAVDHGPR